MSVMEKHRGREGGREEGQAPLGTPRASPALGPNLQRHQRTPPAPGVLVFGFFLFSLGAPKEGSPSRWAVPLDIKLILCSWDPLHDFSLGLLPDQPDATKLGI